jgi:hypothetical protein
MRVMKVRYLKGDTEGQVGYLDYHSIQAALQADPESLEILEGNVENENPEVRELGTEADNLSRGAVTRSPVAASDLSEERDLTVVTTEGHGAAGPDAQRMGPSTVHQAVSTEPGPIADRPGVPLAEGQPLPSEQSAAHSREVADETNRQADEVREEGRRTSERARRNREAPPEEKGSK